MPVHILVLVVFIDGHPHLADLRQHHFAQPGLHHQIDPGHRVDAQQQLVQFCGDTLDGDALQLRGHFQQCLEHPRRHREAELRNEPGRAQHPQRIVAEGHLGRRGRVEHLGLYGRQTAQRIMEFGGAVGGDTYRHGVDGEVPAHQVITEVVAELHGRIPGHLVIAVRPERGDLEAVLDAAHPLAHTDGAELDAGLPQRVGPRAQNLQHLLRAGVGGEIQIAVLGQPAQQRVAHTAADQIQLVARCSEHRAERAQHLGAVVQRDPCAGQQFGISNNSVGHVR
nr:hypothetical protein CPGR_04069 [Mycolicibacterium fortuitum subsp. fortuitum DSM 46621 = ATCC 6841 = JCM 6387]